MGDPVEERRTILENVASGQISPEQAAQLLEAVDKPLNDTEPITGVKVSGTFRPLIIEGDPLVKGAVADGPHIARRSNGVMVFEGDPGEVGPGFVVFGPKSKGRVDINGRKFSWKEPAAALRITMNPDLPLQIDLTAGSVRVSGIRSRIDADVTAGTAQLEEIVSPIDVEIEAGSATISGVLDNGQSRIRCAAGKVSVTLEKGSSVEVTARATLGKLTLPGGNEYQGLGTGKRKVTVGDGKGKLDIEVVTGLVAVEGPDD